MLGPGLLTPYGKWENNGKTASLVLGTCSLLAWANWPESGPHLNLLLQLPLEVLQLLGVGELASGQLGDQGFLLIQLPGQLTWRWEQERVWGLWKAATGA